MAYIQKNVPPPLRNQNFSLNNFTGGLNNNSEDLQAHQSEHLINMKFADNSTMEKRPGIKQFDEITNGRPLIFMDDFRPYNEEDQFLRCYSDGVVSELYSGEDLILSVEGEVMGVNYQGKYFFTDGEKFYVYGKFPQSSVSPYQSVVGNPLAHYIAMEVVNPPNGYTPLDDTHPRGKHVYDYNQRKVWYEPCKNEIEDTSMGSNVLPKNTRFLVVHQGRLFASGDKNDDDNVFISEVQNPYYFPVSLPMQLPPNSDAVRGLVVWDNGVIVGRRDDVFIIDGNTNDLRVGGDIFRLRKINTHTGFANHKSFDVVHNYLFFLGSDGNSYAMSGARQDSKVLSTTKINQTVDLTKSPFNFTKDDFKEACTFFYDNEWYVSIKESNPVEGLKPRDYVIVYNYDRRAWTLYNNHHARSFHKYGDTFIWGDEQGRTLTYSDDYLDLGVPFLAKWTSKLFDMDDPVSYKQFREFFIVMKVYERFTSDVRVRFEVDYADVNDNTVVSSQISRWGISKYGDRYVTRDIMQSFPIIIGRRGRYIRFTFANSWETHATIFSEEQLGSVTNLRNMETLVYTTEHGKYFLFENYQWVEKTMDEVNQPMNVYSINGEYQILGKR